MLKTGQWVVASRHVGRTVKPGTLGIVDEVRQDGAAVVSFVGPEIPGGRWKVRLDRPWEVVRPENVSTASI